MLYTLLMVTKLNWRFLTIDVQNSAHTNSALYTLAALLARYGMYLETVQLD
jgi:hypothetical protein